MQHIDTLEMYEQVLAANNDVDLYECPECDKMFVDTKCTQSAHGEWACCPKCWTLRPKKTMKVRNDVQ
jgi:uncharacterized paraquat-inducible protein A